MFRREDSGGQLEGEGGGGEKKKEKKKSREGLAVFVLKKVQLFQLGM